MNVHYDALALPCAFRFQWITFRCIFLGYVVANVRPHFVSISINLQKLHILSLIAMEILHLNMLDVSFINFCLISNLSNESFKISYENQNSFYLHI